MQQSPDSPLAEPTRYISFADDTGRTLDGDSEEDFLFGGSGTDTLNGLAGNDYLEGGKGNDTLDGGTESDILVGMAGDDNEIVLYKLAA